MINILLQTRIVPVPVSHGHGQVDPKMIIATFIVVNFLLIAILIFSYVKKMQNPDFKNQSAIKNFFFELYTTSDIKRKRDYEALVGGETDAYNPHPTLTAIAFFVINGLALLYVLSYLVYKFILL